MDDLFPSISNCIRPVVVAWDESSLSVTPVPPGLEALLKVQVKNIEEQTTEVEDETTGEIKKIRAGTKVVRRTLSMFVKVKVGDFISLQTQHGFIDLVLRYLQQQSIPYTLHDLRVKVPVADLTKMMGFRFSQRELLERALLQRRSGLIGAPTRFGKSTLIQNCCRAFAGYEIMVMLPGSDLVKQMYDELSVILPDRKITKIVGTTGKQSEDITVCSFDSLHKVNADRVRVVLVDEPHALPTDTRMPEFSRFTKSLKLGFGATLEGRFDGRDPMIMGLIGPVLSNRTYLEAVAEGAIAPIVVYMLRHKVPARRIKNRHTAYKHLFFQNPDIGLTARRIMTPGDVLPAEWQVLGFIHNEDQVKFLSEKYWYDIQHDVAMAKLMNTAERREKMAKLKSGEIRRVAASQIYAQGVTFSDLRVMVNWAGGGASTQALQKPGRVAEIRPGKKAGIVIDYLCIPDEALERSPGGDQSWALVRESAARLAHYKKTGFHVHVVDSLEQIRDGVKTLL